MLVHFDGLLSSLSRKYKIKVNSFSEKHAGNFIRNLKTKILSLSDIKVNKIYHRVIGFRAIIDFQI